MDIVYYVAELPVAMALLWAAIHGVRWLDKQFQRLEKWLMRKPSPKPMGDWK